MASTMPEPYQIHVNESEQTLQITWDNRNSPKDNNILGCLVFFWVVWAPVTLLATCLLLSGEQPIFLTIWCVFGWLGTLGIPYSFLGRWWSEWIEVSPLTIAHGCWGMLAPKP